MKSQTEALPPNRQFPGPRPAMPLTSVRLMGANGHDSTYPRFGWSILPLIRLERVAVLHQRGPYARVQHRGFHLPMSHTTGMTGQDGLPMNGRGERP
jgi:hypothetical protein